MATSTSTSDLIYLAKLAEETSRYDEMMTYMTTVVTTTTTELTNEVRNLALSAYKNVVDKLRLSWLEVVTVQHANSNRASLAKLFQIKLESELTTVCESMLHLLDSYLLPKHATSSDSKVVFLKTKGDYYRYLAEFLVGDKRDNAVDNAKLAYQTAMDIAVEELGPAHPLRLMIFLNFSVFHFEILRSVDEACSLAQKALELCVAEDYTFKEDTYIDTTEIMILLRDNINRWTSSDMEDISLI